MIWVALSWLPFKHPYKLKDLDLFPIPLNTRFCPEAPVDIARNRNYGEIGKQKPGPAAGFYRFRPLRSSSSTCGRYFQSGYNREEPIHGVSRFARFYPT